MPPPELLSDTLRVELAIALRAVRGLEALWVGAPSAVAPLALAEARPGAAHRLREHAPRVLSTLREDTLAGEAGGIVLLGPDALVLMVEVEDDLTLLALAHPAALDEAGVTHLERLADRIDACLAAWENGGVR